MKMTPENEQRPGFADPQPPQTKLPDLSSISHASSQVNGKPAFECLEYRRVDRGKIMGRAKLLMPSGMVILATVIAGEKGLFVAPPAEKWTGKDGTTNYRKLVEFNTPERARSWQQLATQAVMDYLAAHDIQEAPHEDAF